MSALLDAGAEPGVHRGLLDELDSLGEREVLATTAMTKRVLDRTGRSEHDREIAELLGDLRRQVESLEHGGVQRFQRLREPIENTVAELAEQRAELAREAAAVAQDLRSLEIQAAMLADHTRLAEVLGRRLGERGEQVDREVLLTVKQREQDLAAHLAVAMQGIAALRVVEDRNADTLHAIDSATTTTVAALNTAAAAGRLRGV